MAGMLQILTYLLAFYLAPAAVRKDAALPGGYQLADL